MQIIVLLHIEVKRGFSFHQWERGTMQTWLLPFYFTYFNFTWKKFNFQWITVSIFNLLTSLGYSIWKTTKIIMKMRKKNTSKPYCKKKKKKGKKHNTFFIIFDRWRAHISIIVYVICYFAQGRRRRDNAPKTKSFASIPKKIFPQKQLHVPTSKYFALATALCLTL